MSQAEVKEAEKKTDQDGNVPESQRGLLKGEGELNEAGMDADSYISREDFVGVGIVAMQKQANRVDDVRAAFR